jgi:serine/threonine protein kinase
VHQGIKPDSVLVHSRYPLHIKLAGFDLSKASDGLKTICGTHLYTAPGIARCFGSGSPRVGYTHAVDICSLGVVIIEYVYDLPYRGKSEALSWCGEIIRTLGGCGSDCLIDLLSTMVVIDPKSGASAENCLHRVLRLPGLSRSPAPTLASYGLQQPQVREGCQATVVGLGGGLGFRHGGPLDSIRGSEIQRYIRSGVAPRSGAPAFVEERRESTRQSTASSASSGRCAGGTVAASSVGRWPHEEFGLA